MKNDSIFIAYVYMFIATLQGGQMSLWKNAQSVGKPNPFFVQMLNQTFTVEKVA
jgi:hypothetical protein